MKQLIFLFCGFVGFAFAADSLQGLRIDSEVEGAWDQGEWFRDELESVLDGFQGFQVVPRTEIQKMLVRAGIDPNTRSVSPEKLVDSLYPAPFRVRVRVAAPVHTEKRTPVIFFVGRRSIRMETSFHFWFQDSTKQNLRGNLVVDTVFSAGYCGILDCTVRPLPLTERLQIEKALFRRVLAQLQSRLEQWLVIPAQHAEQSQVQSSSGMVSSSTK